MKNGRQAREATGAQHLLGKQCTDRDPRGKTGAAQNLCQQQNRERPPLLRRLLEHARAGRDCVSLLTLATSRADRWDEAQQSSRSASSLSHAARPGGPLQR